MSETPTTDPTLAELAAEVEVLEAQRRGVLLGVEDRARYHAGETLRGIDQTHRNGGLRIAPLTGFAAEAVGGALAEIHARLARLQEEIGRRDPETTDTPPEPSQPEMLRIVVEQSRHLAARLERIERTVREASSGRPGCCA